MKVYGLIVAAGFGAAIVACVPNISLPVTVKTTKGEVFRGMAQGPAFSGNVVLANTNGVRCEGPYKVGQDRIIQATAQCSDGRSASLTASLEADLVSARGSAKMSDGSTAQVGIGKFAELVESGASTSPSRTPAPVREDEKRIVLDTVRSALKDPYSAVFSSVVARKSAGGDVLKVCGLVNAKNSYGGYVGNTPFYVFASREGGRLVPRQSSVTLGNSELELSHIKRECLL